MLSMKAKSQYEVEIHMELGRKIQNARIEKGFTQEQTADALGVSRQTISNWENDKTYPDIVSVIKMSELYSVSLDHLLKEEKSMNQKQTYMEYLEESTNTVKAKKTLEKAILFSVYFLVWAIAETLFLLVKGPTANDCGVIFRWILLPLFTLVAAAIIARNDYWGRANWFSVLAAAVLFFATPYTRYAVEHMTAADAGTTVSYIFIWPNFGYMAIGALVALCGIGIGSFLRAQKVTIR